MSKRALTIITAVAVLVAVAAVTVRVHTGTPNLPDPGPAALKGKPGPVQKVSVHTNAKGGQIVTAHLPDGTRVRGVSCPDGITYLTGTKQVVGTTTTASGSATGGGRVTKDCHIPGVK